MNTSGHGWSRRAFLGAAGAALALRPARSPAAPAAGLAADTEALLRAWCDALLRRQYDEPAKPELHGAFRCPACNAIHGRAGDAAYPLLAMAKRTGNRAYHAAAMRVVDWMKNVDAPDGAWTNETDPKSWKGTTVFAAIALGQALERYGDLLDTGVRERWAARLRRAGQFIHDKIDLDFGNINYGLTAPHALALLGRLLGEDAWRARARELAGKGLAFFTEPNGLVYGEGKPKDRVSPLGCRAVDLGYNVEESLPSLLHYAHLESDEAARRKAEASLEAHLAFMLPDGGWDNSWGTRNYKWTYWGSRTSDGCIPALLLAAGGRPAFLTAARRHLRLLRDCTKDGLLHGGPHYASRGAPPCVHHTFCHAKALADALAIGFPPDADGPPLPREAADGLKLFPEIATWLAARGPWRATVTRYDWIYPTPVWHAAGGALSLLWHPAVGPLFAASLTEYVAAEAHNMQPPPDAGDFPLTPRVEETVGGVRFSNLCDLKATVEARDDAGALVFDAEAGLVNTKGESGGRQAKVQTRIAAEAVHLRLAWSGGGDRRAPELVLPVISDRGEAVRRLADNRIAIDRPGGRIEIEADAPLTFPPDLAARVFNLVPGFLAVPLRIAIPAAREVTCTIRMAAAQNKS